MSNASTRQDPGDLDAIHLATADMLLSLLALLVQQYCLLVQKYFRTGGPGRDSSCHRRRSRNARRAYTPLFEILRTIQQVAELGGVALLPGMTALLRRI